MLRFNHIKQVSSLFLLGFSICVLLSCNQSKPQQQGVTQEQLNAMLDSVKSAAKEEAKAEMEQEAKEQSSQEKYSSTSSSSSSMSPAEAAYKQGYKMGMILHTMRLGLYTENNEKELKAIYMSDCRCSYCGIGEENYNNREIYNEYRHGFFKGFEEGNNAL